MCFYNIVNAQSTNDSLILKNTDEVTKNEKLGAQNPTCEECHEALSLYRDACERRMEFNIQDFLPIVSLIQNCERNKCYGQNQQATYDLNYITYIPNSIYENKLGDYYLNKYKNITHLQSPNAKQIINNFKEIYKTKLSPNCEECIDLFEKYYDSFKSDKFDSSLKILVERCRFQIQNRGVCEELKRKMNNEKFNSKVTFFCISCGISRNGYSSEFVKKWAFPSSGDDIIPTMKKQKYDEVIKYDFINDNVFKINNKWGVMSPETLVFIKPTYDEIKPIKLNKTILFLINSGSKIGIANSNGKELLSPYFEEIIDNQKFFVDKSYQDFLKYGPKMKYLIYKLNGKYGVITNNDSSINISSSIFDEIKFAHNIAILKSGNKVGCINYSFSSYIPPKYDEISNLDLSDNYNFTFYRINNKWGVINADKGTELTNPKFDEIIKTDFRGILKVRIASKFGFIGPQYPKIELAPVIYDEIYPFLNNKLIYARVKNNNKWGLIDNNFNQLIETKYDEVLPLENGYTQVKNNNKWGLIDKNGIVIISTKYDSPFKFINGEATVNLNGTALKINERDEILPNNNIQSNNFTLQSSSSRNPNGAITSNKFPELSLSEITTDNKTLKTYVYEYFQTVYNEVNSKTLLGVWNKNEVQEVLIGANNIIMKGFEKMLGGPMTKAQLQEFNEIKNNAAAASNLAMGLIKESLKSDNSSSSRPSNGQKGMSSPKSNKHYCKWCGKIINGDGYSISMVNGTDIHKGKNADFLAAELGARLLGINEKTDNTGDYCSKECSTKALLNRKKR